VECELKQTRKQITPALETSTCAQWILEEKSSYTAMLAFESSLCVIHRTDCALLAVESSSNKLSLLALMVKLRLL